MMTFERNSPGWVGTLTGGVCSLFPGRVGPVKSLLWKAPRFTNLPCGHASAGVATHCPSGYGQSDLQVPYTVCSRLSPVISLWQMAVPGIYRKSAPYRLHTLTY